MTTVTHSISRTALENFIEAALALLETYDTDPDLEDTHDREPSLGSVDHDNQSRWGDGLTADLEEVNEDGDDSDKEPSLAAPEAIYPSSQEYWADDNADELEDDCDKEPFLGWAEPDQQPREGGIDPSGDPSRDHGRLHFDGNGRQAARDLLRQAQCSDPGYWLRRTR